MKQTLLWLLMAGACPLLLGAEPRTALERAQDASRRAVELADAGRWGPAEEALHKAMERLPADPSALEARAMINFSRGWVLAQKAQAAPEDAAAARAAAEFAYRDVLRDFPGNAQAAVNLALLLEPSEPRQAQQVLEDAERAGGSDALHLGLARADLLLRQGDALKSWDVLWTLSRRVGTNGAVAERLVRLYPLLPADRLPMLSSFCEQLDNEGFGVLARRGWEELVRLSWKSDPELAERALVLWTAHQVRQGHLSPEVLARLPSQTEWQSPALSGLHSLVAGVVETNGWWQAAPEHAHVASGVLRVVADQAAFHDDRPKAKDLYRKAMSAAPKLESYGAGGLHGQPAAGLEAAIPLARLLHRENASAADVDEYRAVIDELWQGKNAEYRSLNVLGIVQYHRVLGAIHTDQKEYNQAEYHLKRLLDFEDRLAVEEKRKPAPQPEVHAMLAKGLEANNQFDAAARQYVLAARGYLLQNDPGGASVSLARVKPRWELSDVRLAEVSAARDTTVSVARFLRAEGNGKTQQLERVLAACTKAPSTTDAGGSAWQADLVAKLAGQVPQAALANLDPKAVEHWRTLGLQWEGPAPLIPTPEQPKSDIIVVPPKSIDRQPAGDKSDLKPVPAPKIQVDREKAKPPGGSQGRTLDVQQVPKRPPTKGSP